MQNKKILLPNKKLLTLVAFEQLNYGMDLVSNLHSSVFPVRLADKVFIQSIAPLWTLYIGTTVHFHLR